MQPVALVLIVLALICLLLERAHPQDRFDYATLAWAFFFCSFAAQWLLTAHPIHIG